MSNKGQTPGKFGANEALYQLCSTGRAFYFKLLFLNLNRVKEKQPNHWYCSILRKSKVSEFTQKTLVQFGFKHLFLVLLAAARLLQDNLVKHFGFFFVAFVD